MLNWSLISTWQNWFIIPIMILLVLMFFIITADFVREI